MTPQKLRAQLEVYADHGFTVASLEPRKGSHYAVTFEQFSQVQFLTINVGDPRSPRNNLSRFKRLAKEAQHATA
jgi:hypothetical protein